MDPNRGGSEGRIPGRVVSAVTYGDPEGTDRGVRRSCVWGASGYDDMTGDLTCVSGTPSPVEEGDVETPFVTADRLVVGIGRESGTPILRSEVGFFSVGSQPGGKTTS